VLARIDPYHHGTNVRSLRVSQQVAETILNRWSPLKANEQPLKEVAKPGTSQADFFSSPTEPPLTL